MIFTQRQKKLIVVGVILVAVAGVYRLLPFFQQVISSEDRTVVERRILSLQKKIVHKKELVRQRVVLERQLGKLESGLLQGATHSLAAVTIQNLLYDLARKYNVGVQSVRVLKAEKAADENLSMYTVVAIQARMVLSISQLEKILYGLAKSSKLLVVNGLSANIVTRGKPGQIMVTLTLKGLMVER